MRFASCCARLVLQWLRKPISGAPVPMQTDQRSVIPCLFRRHLRPCLRGGSARLTNAPAEDLVAFDAPQLPSGSREPDAALGGSTSSKLTCREKQRKSG